MPRLTTESLICKTEAKRLVEHPTVGTRRQLAKLRYLRICCTFISIVSKSLLLLSLFCLFICSYTISLSFLSFHSLHWTLFSRTNCVFLTTSWRRKAFWRWVSQSRLWWMRPPPNTASWCEQQRRRNLNWHARQTHTRIDKLTGFHMTLIIINCAKQYYVHTCKTCIDLLKDFLCGLCIQYTAKQMVEQPKLSNGELVEGNFSPWMFLFFYIERVHVS